MAARRDHPTGVVCYRLDQDQISKGDVREALESIAKLLAEPGGGIPPFVLRMGFRRDPNSSSHYWVGLNDRDIGSRMFERLLSELDVRPTRALKMPGGDPHPELKAVLDLPGMPDAQSVPDALALEEVSPPPMEVGRGRRIDFKAWGGRLSDLRSRARMPGRRRREA